MVIVDSSAWVEFFRAKGDVHVKLAVAGLLEVYESTLCGPVEMEILGGARAHEIKEIQIRFDILQYVRSDQKVWRKAAGNFAKMKIAGFTIPWNDILIATIAIERGLRVYAHDKHFSIMADTIGVRLYTSGYNGMFNPEP